MCEVDTSSADWFILLLCLSLRCVHVVFVSTSLCASLFLSAFSCVNGVLELCVFVLFHNGDEVVSEMSGDT